jgi:hypothetical protein
VKFSEFVQSARTGSAALAIFAVSRYSSWATKLHDGQVFFPAWNVTSSFSFAPDLPLTSAQGFAQGEPRGGISPLSSRRNNSFMPFADSVVAELLAQENIPASGTSDLDDLYWILPDRQGSTGDANNADGTVQIHNDY